MFTPEAARIIGIKPRTLRAYLRNIGYSTAGSRYEFTMDEVQQLKRRYWAGVRHTPERKGEFVGTPGLPVSYVLDPDKQPLLEAERIARINRLHARLLELGMDISQMPDDELIRCNRALFISVDNDNER
jgi:hypothetical protein